MILIAFLLLFNIIIVRKTEFCDWRLLIYNSLPIQWIIFKLSFVRQWYLFLSCPSERSCPPGSSVCCQLWYRPHSNSYSSSGPTPPFTKGIPSSFIILSSICYSWASYRRLFCPFSKQTSRSDAGISCVIGGILDLGPHRSLKDLATGIWQRTWRCYLWCIFPCSFYRPQTRAPNHLRFHSI